MEESNTIPSPMTPLEVNDDSGSDNSIEDTTDMNKSLSTSIVIGKKKRKLSSEVWTYFIILTPKANEELKCKCKKCHQVYSIESKNGTE